MRSIRINPWSALAGAGAVAYPFLVWFGRTAVPPAGFVLIGVACIAARMVATRRLVWSSVEITVFLLAAVLLVGLLAVSPAIAARFYPVAISLALATIFGASLRFPPTVIERIARLTEPDLPPEGVVYTRKVTAVWVGFLLVNAAISLWTVLWGSLEQWALWNGLLSYLAMGILFTAEYLVRRVVRR
jgi:uncharacterized membrane protein